jgi:nucleoside-diphosphate-sugar epimerase
MVGENQRDTLVTEIFIQQAMELEKYTVNGDGSQRRNWVDVEDAARAFVMAVEQPNLHGVFNIAGAKSLSVKQLVRRVHQISGRCCKPKIQFKPPREGDFDEVVNSRKAWKTFGWKPESKVTDALKRVYEARREHWISTRDM